MGMFPSCLWSALVGLEYTRRLVGVWRHEACWMARVCEARISQQMLMERHSHSNSTWSTTAYILWGSYAPSLASEGRVSTASLLADCFHRSCFFAFWQLSPLCDMPSHPRRLLYLVVTQAPGIDCHDDCDAEVKSYRLRTRMYPCVDYYDVVSAMW